MGALGWVMFQWVGNRLIIALAYLVVCVAGHVVIGTGCVGWP
jgi:hypothetical protein